MPKPDDKNYIVEYISLGNAVKVTAFDPTTLKEVSIVGAAGTPKRDLANLAIRKLHYVLRKQKPK